MLCPYRPWAPYGFSKRISPVKNLYSILVWLFTNHIKRGLLWLKMAKSWSKIHLTMIDLLRSICPPKYFFKMKQNINLVKTTRIMPKKDLLFTLNIFPIILIAGTLYLTWPLLRLSAHLFIITDISILDLLYHELLWMKGFHQLFIFARHISERL